MSPETVDNSVMRVEHRHRRRILHCAFDVCSPHMKEEILEALVLDNDLRANRSVAAQNAMGLTVH